MQLKDSCSHLNGRTPPELVPARPRSRRLLPPRCLGLISPAVTYGFLLSHWAVSGRCVIAFSGAGRLPRRSNGRSPGQRPWRRCAAPPSCQAPSPGKDARVGERDRMTTPAVAFDRPPSEASSPAPAGEARCWMTARRSARSRSQGRYDPLPAGIVGPGPVHRGPSAAPVMTRWSLGQRPRSVRDPNLTADPSRTCWRAGQPSISSPPARYGATSVPVDYGGAQPLSCGLDLYTSAASG